MTGIYMIKNIYTEKVYIGQAINIESRWKTHRYMLRNNKHENSHLQHSWNKYGEKSFIFSIIEECENEQLTEREQYWIDYYGGINSVNTYNNRDAGSHGAHSQEAKDKISKAGKGRRIYGRTVSDEGKKSLSEAHKGIIPTQETREKMSMSQKGRKHSDISKQKISKKVKAFYDNNSDIRKRISERQSGRTLSDETREKISKARKERIITEDTKIKLSNSLKNAYKNGTGKFAEKQSMISIFGITMNQSNWAKLLEINHASISNAYKKGDDFGKNYVTEKFVLYLYHKGLLDDYINQLVEKKGMIADAVVDGKVSLDDINFLLS